MVLDGCPVWANSISSRRLRPGPSVLNLNCERPQAGWYMINEGEEMLHAREAVEMDEVLSSSTSLQTGTMEKCHQWVWPSARTAAVRLSEG